MKPGIKTTEFWLSLFAVAFFAYVAMPEAASWKVKATAVVAACLTALGYGKFRSDQKTTTQELAPDPAPRGFARQRTLVVLAVAAVLALGLAGCSYFTAQRKSQVGHAIVACGIGVGMAELRQLDNQVHDKLADARLTDEEAHQALDALKKTAEAGLVDCLVKVGYAMFGPEQPAAPTASSPVVAASARMAIKYEAPKERAGRRARAYLERLKK